MHRPIMFLHRGQPREVSDLPVTSTVLSWLREQARCTGTKEGCNEGDCGACTVVVAELADGIGADASPTAKATVVDGLRLRPMNACLMFLPMVDGRAVLTVEDLCDHPVQRAMVECHGSQCGFCTPGFVMTMVAGYEHCVEHQQMKSRREWAHELAGNLCRCTGYRPILDAAERSLQLPVQRLDTAALRAGLLQLRHRMGLRSLDYRSVDPGSGHMQRIQAPGTVQAVADALEEDPHARLLAGATDMALWSNKGLRPLGNLIHLGAARDMQAITIVEQANGQRVLRIGAAASLEEAWGALCAEQPSLREVTLRFASPPVRHLGTMGGNIANGSPIGDSAPALMALGATLQLRRGASQRTVALDEFYLGYMKNSLERGEFIEALNVPLPDEHTVLRAWKISKRFDSDISAVCGAFAMEFDTQRQLRGVRIAYGGMAATVSRARRAESALQSHGWSKQGIEQAILALAVDYAPLTDLRATARYRLRVAGQLLQRLWLELNGSADARHGVSVWQELLVQRAP